MADTAQGSDAHLDLGTTGGEWVFNRDGLMFGPAPASVVIDHLMAGEIDGTTPVGREGDALRPLREVAFFRGHLPRAETRRREREAEQVAQAAAQRKRRTRALVMAGSGALGGVVLAAGLVVALRGPGPGAGALADVDVEISPPRIAAVPEPGGEELVDYVDGQKRAPTRPAAPAAHRGDAPAEAPSPDGLAVESSYDRSAIDKALRTQQALLFPCLREAAQRDGGLRGEVPFSFTIANDGRVSRIWVDKPGYADGPLASCLNEKAARMRFASFEGERPTVSLSFQVRAPPPR